MPMRFFKFSRSSKVITTIWQTLVNTRSEFNFHHDVGDDQNLSKRFFGNLDLVENGDYGAVKTACRDMIIQKVTNGIFHTPVLRSILDFTMVRSRENRLTRRDHPESDQAIWGV